MSKKAGDTKLFFSFLAAFYVKRNFFRSLHSVFECVLDLDLEFSGLRLEFISLSSFLHISLPAGRKKQFSRVSCCD